jgi:hypothetical protein
MNFLKKIFNTVTICCLMMLTMSLSCSKSDDEPAQTPIREFSEQYADDIAVIEYYLKDYTYTINSNNDITFSLHTATSPNPKLISLLNATTFPKLLTKNVELHNLTYKVYYLIFDEGNVAKQPTPVDLVLAAYRGFYLENQDGVLGTTAEFENNPNPTNLFSLTGVIRGWTEIFPLFGSGIVDTSGSSNDPIVYQDYGVGAIFIPSGLGYFNTVPNGSTIPPYSPLVFTFKLLDIKRSDNDGDKIESINEIVKNADNTFTYTDSDADGNPDFQDFDDDNDGYTTLSEIKNGDTYYLFNDIPTCTVNGKKRHLDPTCHN